MNKDNLIFGTEYLPKVKAIYQAVFELFEEGADLNSLTVSEITRKAGIGKGTAYEYFSDKEEMIGRAICYNVEVFCGKIYEASKKEKTLYDKVNYVLLAMERQVPDANCIFRLIHIISGNSVTSRRFREVVEQQRLFGEMPVVNVIKRILTDVLKDREALSEEKEAYLVMSIYSRIWGYGMLLNEERYKQPEERASMRSLICRGICKEVDEIDIL
ncbi:MAG: TetR/AcrR family transcriptional regulator [Lachnospiraceae bacterium]|nr:TetR/AcrR family transcriptional regulator [Lachnospiraceae bacterium]